MIQEAHTVQYAESQVIVHSILNVFIPRFNAFNVFDFLTFVTSTIYVLT